MNIKLLLFILISYIALTATPISHTASSQSDNHLKSYTAQVHKVSNLNTSLDYQTIQEAIDAPETQDRHVIMVDAATYYESLLIHKSIVLLGENMENATIDSDYSTTAVTITADNVTISGFTIQHGGNQWPHFWAGGILVMESEGCNISYNRIIWNYYFGIYLLNSNNSFIFENEIYRNYDRGIYLDNANNNTIRDNIITYNRDGFYMSHSNGNIISRNWITENSYVGIKMGHCYGNTIWHNNFIDNTHQVTHYSPPLPPNMWNNNLEGNYWAGYWNWSSYSGFDHYSGPHQNETGSDGIGDTPYIIDENNKDNYPLMGMFYRFNTPLGYYVNIISNFTIDGFGYFEVNNTIRMYVSYEEENDSIPTSGFCRVSIHHELMDTDNIIVVINNNQTSVLYHNYSLYDNTTHKWIYFAYPHSAYEVAIQGLPSQANLFPTWVIGIIVMMTLVGAGLTVYLIKLKKRTGKPNNNQSFHML